MKMNIKTKCYLAVDKDGTARLFRDKPIRVNDKYWDAEQAAITIPEDDFLGLPRNRTWQDEPLEVIISFT